MTYTEAYELCCKKAYLHFEKLNDALFEPGEAADGDYCEKYPNTDFVSNRWVWLTSMITGMAPLVFETKNDTYALKWANRFKGEYHDKVFAPFTQTIEAEVVEIVWGYNNGHCDRLPASLTPLGEKQKIKLIPYGCTNLRMTEIPYVK